MSCPHPPPNLDGRRGARLYWDSLPAFSNIGGPKSYNKIKISYTRYKNKTTTIVVFTVSIHIVLSPIYINIYQKLYIYIYIIRAQNLQVMDPYKCTSPTVCGRSRTSSLVPTRIKTYDLYIYTCTDTHLQ